ncbi:MAG: cation:proton antiporter subunit C [Oscillospiraceae bacterium]|nr:cation:proton antiporter subunit C [Oscillospiraceae bacterium]
MNFIELAALVLFFICFYGLITSRKMIKTIVFMVMMQSAVIMFFLSFGFHPNNVPPMGAYFEDLSYVADPLTQALMITAIIIGVAVTTIAITMLMSLFRTYQTTDWDEVKECSMEQE